MAISANATSNLTGQLMIQGAADAFARITMGLNTTSGVGFIQSYYNTGAAYTLCLNPTYGNVTVGTTSNSGRLHVQTSGNSTWALYLQNSNGNILGGFYQSASAHAAFYAADSAGSYRFQYISNSSGYALDPFSFGTTTAVPAGSSVRIDSGALAIMAQYDLRLYDGDSSNYLAIKAPLTIAANYTLTMPADDGNAGQYLQTDGTGVLTWANGPTGAQGSPGVQGAQGAQGSQGAQGFQGAKPAIVPIQTFLGEEYVELLCVEMPEVYFEDFMTVKAGNQGHQSHIVTREMDSTFMQVCEPGTIKVTSTQPSLPVPVGARVQGPSVEIEVSGEPIQNSEVDVTVRLSGIRAGMVGRRFAKRTYDQMVKNNRFWEQWSQ